MVTPCTTLRSIGCDITNWQKRRCKRRCSRRFVSQTSSSDTPASELGCSRSYDAKSAIPFAAVWLTRLRFPSTTKRLPNIFFLILMVVGAKVLWRMSIATWRTRASQNCLSVPPQATSNSGRDLYAAVLEEKEVDDICKDLDISTNYWTRLHRARLGLAKCVSDNWPIDNETNNAPHQ